MAKGVKGKNIAKMAAAKGREDVIAEVAEELAEQAEVDALSDEEGLAESDEAIEGPLEAPADPWA